MNIGLSFEESNSEKLFCNLHSLMDISLYDWYIDDVDLNYFYFRSGRYCGIEFQNTLEKISELSFARIRRYPVGQSIDCIDEYEDYLNSECDLLILFYDGGYFEIYEKDEELLSRTFDFCINSAFENISYVSDSDNIRSYMHF